jgi:hypothetical protein
VYTNVPVVGYGNHVSDKTLGCSGYNTIGTPPNTSNSTFCNSSAEVRHTGEGGLETISRHLPIIICSFILQAIPWAEKRLPNLKAALVFCTVYML